MTEPIVATYDVKITIRKSSPDAKDPEHITNADLEQVIETAIAEEFEIPMSLLNAIATQT